MEKLPVYFIPHGGGPWHAMHNAMGDTLGYAKLRTYLSNLGNNYTSIAKSILIISGHWEEQVTTIHFGKNHSLLYDYYGFPVHTYHFNWAPSGNPELALKIETILKANDIEVNREYKRGIDHGVFVPLMIAFPEAQIPIVQISLLDTLAPELHLKLGEALEMLRNEGVLIIGSGMSYHHLQGFMSGNAQALKDAEKFDNWLTNTITMSDIKARKNLLINWHLAPSALKCHPRSEHLLPLHVIVGAAGNDIGKQDFTGTIMGIKISGFKFG